MTLLWSVVSYFCSWFLYSSCVVNERRFIQQGKKCSIWDIEVDFAEKGVHLGKEKIYIYCLCGFRNVRRLCGVDLKMADGQREQKKKKYRASLWLKKKTIHTHTKLVV